MEELGSIPFIRDVAKKTDSTKYACTHSYPTHLVPNSITVVSTFIHFCEAYLGIPPHFALWRHFFYVKKNWQKVGASGGCDVQFEVRP
jgi:hypothetical protein